MSLIYKSKIVDSGDIISVNSFGRNVYSKIVVKPKCIIYAPFVVARYAHSRPRYCIGNSNKYFYMRNALEQCKFFIDIP